MAEKLSLTKEEARLAIEWEHEDFDIALKELFWRSTSQESYHVILKRKSDGKYFEDYYVGEIGMLPFESHSPNFTEVERKETIMVQWVPVR